MKATQYCYVDRKTPPNPYVMVSDFERVIEPEEDPDTSWLDEPENADERARYDRGELSFVGVRARVTLYLPAGHRSPSPEAREHSHPCFVHVVESPGNWGIDSDAPEVDLNEAFEEQSELLVDMLRALGTIKVVGVNEKAE